MNFMKKKKHMGIRIFCALLFLGISGSVMFSTDFTLYVCRMNYTHKNVLSEIVEIQRSGQLNQISLVVNGGNLAEKKYGYGYGYGYSYGYRDTHKKHK